MTETAAMKERSGVFPDGEFRRLWREAGGEGDAGPGRHVWMERQQFLRFLRSFSVHIRNEERERCARIADPPLIDWKPSTLARPPADLRAAIAAEIRAQQKPVEPVLAACDRAIAAGEP
jgi:hypothetical protein